jgi:alpha-tubulin suppressor-like RCC1 family protein
MATGRKEGNSDHTNGWVSVNGNLLRDVIGVSVNQNASLALTREGKVVVWGDLSQPQGLSNVVAISAGFLRALALKKDGSVFCWGKRFNSLGDLTNVSAISAAKAPYWNDVALCADGSIIEQDSTEQHRVSINGGVVIAISAGHNHSLALNRDGTVFGWGANDGGQATGIPKLDGDRQSSGLVMIDGERLTNVVQIAAGNEYSLALKRDGHVVAWGNKRFYTEMPPDLTNVVSIVAGQGYCLAIQKR